MNYEEAMKWLDSQDFLGMKFGLERIRHLMKELGSPEKRLKVVHVTGTNGKGSVCAMIGSILAKSGYKTGVYTSPHLVDFRERITVNGKMIGKDELSGVFGGIVPIAEKMKDNEETGRPTYFEIATAAALCHFRNEGCDFAVVEVGLGGRLDATNVVDPPLVAVVTNISMEHTEYLGRDLASIAKEKAAIIKKGCSVVTAAEGEALRVIEEKCRETGSDISVLGRDFSFVKTSAGLSGEGFDYRDGKGYSVKIPLLGDHQIENASCAITAIEALGRKGFRITKSAVEGGLSKVCISGRFEIAGKSPYLVLDGAHNPAGMRSARKALEELFPGKKTVIIVSICSDKDIPGMVKEIAPSAEKVIVTRHSLKERAGDPEVIAAEAGKYCKSVEVVRDVGKALERARILATKDDLILVAGSLYLVGDVKKLL
jgi:dihydrofolate synthase/folylpolyglutamate synthase